MNSAATYLTFATERHDTDSMHSTSSNTGRIVFTAAGVYGMFANVALAANATGYRLVGIEINRSGTTIAATQVIHGGATAVIVPVSTQYQVLGERLCRGLRVPQRE